MPDNPESPTTVLRMALSELSAKNFYYAPMRDGALHKKVCAVVDELKGTGMTPEQVLLAVKGIAAEANVGLKGVPLVATMVKWCLEQYFKEKTA